MAVEDKLDIKLNQNIWGLVFAYAALGAAEYWELNRLRCLALLMAIYLSLSVVMSIGFYTFHYCVRKCTQARGIWTRRTMPSERAGK